MGRSAEGGEGKGERMGPQAPRRTISAGEEERDTGCVCGFGNTREGGTLLIKKGTGTTASVQVEERRTSCWLVGSTDYRRLKLSLEIWVSNVDILLGEIPN